MKKFVVLLGVLIILKLIFYFLQIVLQFRKNMPVVKEIIDEKKEELRNTSFNKLVEKIGQGLQEEVKIKNEKEFVVQLIVERPGYFKKVGTSEHDKFKEECLRAGENLDAVEVWLNVDWYDWGPCIGRTENLRVESKGDKEPHLVTAINFAKDR